MSPLPGEKDELVRRLVERLLALSGSSNALTLDAIAEASAELPLSFEEIDALIETLEQRGCRVHQPTLPLQSDLKRVLGAARAFRAAEHRTPRISDLATATGLEPAAVLAALRFAQTIA